MKKLMLVTASLVALGAVAPAVAADLAARPYTKAPPMVQAAYDWSGFYIGVNGGGGTSRNSWDLVGGLPQGNHDATGGTIGGQVGYRWQTGPIVFGVEGQGNWADFSGDNVSQVIPGNRNRTKIDAFGLFTGQVGYSWQNVLLYVKGGAVSHRLARSVNSRPDSVDGHLLGSGRSPRRCSHRSRTSRMRLVVLARG